MLRRLWFKHGKTKHPGNLCARPRHVLAGYPEVLAYHRRHPLSRFTRLNRLTPTLHAEIDMDLYRNGPHSIFDVSLRSDGPQQWPKSPFQNNTIHTQTLPGTAVSSSRPACLQYRIYRRRRLIYCYLFDDKVVFHSPQRGMMTNCYDKECENIYNS